MRHTFGRPFHRVRRSSLDKLDRVSLFEAESNAEEAVLRQHIVQLPRGVVDLQIADNWQSLCGMADTVFAEYNRDHPEIQAQRDLARERGRYLMEVLC